jgi:chromosome segregation ATPase
MRTRHRIPSIFNLSMVDVLCCALGCVILLWLLNMREAQEKASQAGQTGEELARTQDELTRTQADLAAAVKDRDGLRVRLETATGQVADLTARAASLQGQLDDTGRKLTVTEKKLKAAEDDVASTAGKLADAQKDRDKLRTGLADAQAERDKFRMQLADLTKAMDALALLKKDVDDRLALKTKDAGDLDKKLAAADKRIAALEADVKDKDALALANARKADALQVKLNDSEDRGKKLQAVADLVPGLRDDLKGYRDKYAQEEALAKSLEKEIAAKVEELAALGKTVKELQALRQSLERDLAAKDKDLTTKDKEDRAKLAAAEDRLLALGREKDKLLVEKTTLEREADRLRLAADNRFEGVELTGKRVVFLVDMSGSMTRVNYDTLDPNKWPGVAAAVAKVMKSLPDLEKFQVIMFSEKYHFLLGSDGKWLDYEGKTTVDKVQKAIVDTPVKGGTNMYDALEAAFKFRDQGLDAVYLFSDGLPNLGEGLTAEVAKLKEEEQGEILGKVISKKLKTDWNKPVAGKRVRINSIGFFYESPDVGAFLWLLARENDGSFVGMSKP